VAVSAEHRSTSWSVNALLTTTLCSSAATLALVTALGKLVYDITGDELDLGLLGLVEFAPAALLVLVTGAVADRFQRRLVATLAYLGEAVVTAVLAVHVLGEPTGVGGIFALVGAFGLARAFAAPASRALPADIVAPERLPWLIPRTSGVHQVAVIVGPVLGGFLFTVSPAAPMVAAVVLQLAAALAVSTVRPWRDPALGSEPLLDAPLLQASAPRSTDEGPGPQPTKAAGATRSRACGSSAGQPVLLGAISLDLFAVLFGGAVALLPGDRRGPPRRRCRRPRLAAGRGRDRCRGRHGRARAATGAPAGRQGAPRRRRHVRARHDRARA
jgi:MFS family permease